MQQIIKATPIIYLLTGYDHQKLEDIKNEYVKWMEEEGFQVKLIIPPVRPKPRKEFDLEELLPLDQIRHDRERVAMFIYDINQWEKNDKVLSLEIQPSNPAHSMLRAAMISSFKGIPFLNINNQPKSLAGKWGVEAHSSIIEAHKFNKPKNRLNINQKLRKPTMLHAAMVNLFKCIPFLSVKTQSNSLAGKWGCEARSLIIEARKFNELKNRLNINKKLKKSKQSDELNNNCIIEEIEYYYRNKFFNMIFELNIGYYTTPYPNQFNSKFNAPAANKKLINIAMGKNMSARLLECVIAHTVPSGDIVGVRCISEGLSDALVFVVYPQGKAGILIKLAPWLESLCEFEGMQFVIGPRLKTFVASLVNTGVGIGPVFYRDEKGTAWGSIAYNLVGSPDQSTKLESLKTLINNTLGASDHGKADFLRAGVSKTLKEVIVPIHGAKESFTYATDTLWGWLGTSLPPVFTATLAEPTKDPNNTIGSFRTKGYKRDAAFRLAECEWNSKWNGEGSPWIVKLKGFILLEFDIKDGVHSVIVRHPDLGFRIECIDTNAVLSSAEWPPKYMKYGFPVELCVSPLPNNRNYSLYEEVFDSAQKNKQTPRTPLDMFFYRSACQNILPPLSYTYCARMSPIHGDLNLSNILFTDGIELGWLIDFDSSCIKGLTAFDFAKLEVELLSHFLIPRLIDLSSRYPNLCVLRRKNKSFPNDSTLLASVLSTLDSLDVNQDIVDQWKLMLNDKQLLGNDLHNSSLDPIWVLLRLLAVFRRAAMSALIHTKEPHDPHSNHAPSDLALAISACAFSAIKHAVKRSRRDIAEDLAIVSEWYVRQAIPVFSPKEESGKIPETLDATMEPPETRKTLETSSLEQLVLMAGPKARLDIDKSLLSLSKKKLSEIINEIAATKKPKVEWDVKAWDFASTGCVANISPIVGYLWLMTRNDLLSKGAEHKDKICVPKISSRGAGGGTVDTLEAGGYPFSGDFERIKKIIKNTSGVFCKQEDALVRVDKAAMARRKVRNLMKDPKLMLASVLAKKLVMGCQHAVIDVKLGRDTKVIPLSLSSKEVGIVSADAERLISILPNEAAITAAKALLTEAGLSFMSSDSTGHFHEIKTNDETSGTKLANMETLRLVFTSADVPQCQAIGRNLILLMLFREFELQSEENESNKPFNWAESYREFYLKVIPASLDIVVSEENEKQANERLRVAWQRLLTQLPNLAKKNEYDVFKLQEPFNTLNAIINNKECSVQSLNGPLEAKTYPIPGQGQTKVNFIDAYELDDWFDELCKGASGEDREVGFWMHVLPGGQYKFGTPFITVFYNKDRINASRIDQRMARFLSRDNGYIEL